MGPATQQIALRGAFYLTCGTVLLERNALNAKKGEAQKPGQLLAFLAATRQGLEQLAQAIFDGRRGYPVRCLEKDQCAADPPTSPTDDKRMTAPNLRTLALASDDSVEDQSASAMLAEDGDELRRGTMEGRSDDDKIPTIVQQRGWKDPRGTIAPDLENAAKLVRKWEMLHEIIGQSSSGNLKYDEGDTVGADL